jgi:hypothetical protein
MGIRKQEKVFKKICELKGWKFHKYSNDGFYLLTDIEAPRHDEDCPAYVYIEFRHWYGGDETFEFDFSEKPLDRISVGYHINGKCPQWKVPKACDFSDISKAQDYVNMIIDYFAKKSTKVNKDAKKKDLNFVSQRAEYFDFYEKMNKLAIEHNGSFKEDEHKLLTWEFSGVDINWYYEPSKDLTKNCWRVRIPSLNYSYFRCKTLDEVYDLCKWYAEMPNMPTYKF